MRNRLPGEVAVVVVPAEQPILASVAGYLTTTKYGGWGFRWRFREIRPRRFDRRLFVGCVRTCTTSRSVILAVVKDKTMWVVPEGCDAIFVGGDYAGNDKTEKTLLRLLVDLLKPEPKKSVAKPESELAMV